MLNTATLDAPSAPERTAPAELTISAIEMARLTGVGRERLRTWERRHGFPEPVRTAKGIRRYKACDVRAIVAIARLVESGVQLGDAMQRVQLEESLGASAEIDTLGTALDQIQTAAIAVAGPTPLKIVWRNVATVKSPEGPEADADLLDHRPEFGSGAVSAIQRLMASERSEPAIVTHLDWTTPFPTERRSLAWRLPTDVSAAPVVVLMQLPESDQRGAVASDAGPWAAALRASRDVLERTTGLIAVQRAVGELARATGAMEAFLATCHNGRLRAASSVRGTISARELHLDSGGTAWNAINEGQVDWLDADSLRAVGAPPRCEALVIPMVAGGTTLGAVFVMFPTELRLCDLSRELLHTLGALLATTLQREHQSALIARSRVSA